MFILLHSTGLNISRDIKSTASRASFELCNKFLFAFSVEKRNILAVLLSCFATL